MSLPRKKDLMQLIDAAGLTIESTARRANVSEVSLRKAIRGDPDAQVNTSTARSIADALGTTVDAINWKGGLANQGRPAGTGGRYTRQGS